MDEFDILKMFFKTPKDYIKDIRQSIRHKEPEDDERYRADEVKDEDMFDQDQVAKGDDIDSHVGCICLMLTKKPMVGGAKCSAIACQNGVIEFNDKDQRGPIGRAEKGFHLSLEQAIKQEESILMKCKYKDCDSELTIKNIYEHLSKCVHAPYKGSAFPECKIIVKRRDVHSHRDECDYCKVRCRYFHSHLLFRKDLENHEQNECEFKTLLCKGCKKNFYKSVLLKHIHEGNLYPTECSNCKESVKRQDLDKHAEMGPKAIIPCIAFKTGKFETTRDKIDEHQKNGEDVYYAHLEMISDFKDQLDAKNELIQVLNASVNKKKGIFGGLFS